MCWKSVKLNSFTLDYINDYEITDYNSSNINMEYIFSFMNH